LPDLGLSTFLGQDKKRPLKTETNSPIETSFFNGQYLIRVRSHAASTSKGAEYYAEQVFPAKQTVHQGLRTYP
jgi:hypothetical protein